MQGYTVHVTSQPSNTATLGCPSQQRAGWRKKVQSPVSRCHQGSPRVAHLPAVLPAGQLSHRPAAATGVDGAPPSVLCTVSSCLPERDFQTLPRNQGLDVELLGKQTEWSVEGGFHLLTWFTLRTKRRRWSHSNMSPAHCGGVG